MGYHSIAGLTVEIEPTGMTAQRIEPYALPEPAAPDITINVSARDVLERNPVLKTLDVAEYMGTGTMFARQLLKFGGFQLHASAVICQGKAYLFSAPSGMGKSTHTEKWCRLFGCRMLNDDKPVLRRFEGSWVAYGTPWSGKHDISSPEGVPLGGIAFLHRGEDNEIHRLPPVDAVAMMISQSPRFLNAAQMTAQLELMDKLLQEVPIWKLTCRDDDEAAEVSRSAMVGE